MAMTSSASASSMEALISEARSSAATLQLASRWLVPRSGIEGAGFRIFASQVPSPLFASTGPTEHSFQPRAAKTNSRLFLSRTGNLRSFSVSSRKSNLDAQDKEQSYCRLIDRSLAFYDISGFIPGIIICPAVTTFLKSKFGHRVSIRIGLMLNAVGVLLGVCASNERWLLIGRIVEGAGFSFLYQAVPSFLAEMSPTDCNGALVCAVQGVAKGGAFFTGFVNLIFNKEKWWWRPYLSFPFIPLGIGLFYATFKLPHTSRGLSEVRNEADGAGEAHDVPEGLQSISTGPAAAGSRQANSLSESPMRLSIIAGILMPLFTPLTGVNMFGPVMYQGMGFTLHAALVIDTVTSFFSSIASLALMFYVDKLGRKKLLIVGDLSMLVLNIMLGELGKGEKAHGTLSILCLIAIAVCFGISWGPMGFLIPSEAYPPEILSFGIGLSTAASFFFSALINFFQLPLLCRFKDGIFSLYAINLAVALAYVCFFLPETGGGVPLQQIRGVWSGHRLFGRPESDQPENIVDVEASATPGHLSPSKGTRNHLQVTVQNSPRMPGRI
ncbi:hypothetical protein SAY86_018599 [Trapa natans]|uniref:Major facilitator superfamily (MFS) profile domain-containing protein n=1 Tax=Trapa natans TaxID=22666 RepID=A0AAN7R1V9_TRANT|nr:hypothetical protein SAY86_018599 [Trapa natans]